MKQNDGTGYSSLEINEKFARAKRSYLVSATYGGKWTCEFAFNNGENADRSPWRVRSDIEIAQSAIDHYAELRPPDEWRGPDPASAGRR